MHGMAQSGPNRTRLCIAAIAAFLLFSVCILVTVMILCKHMGRIILVASSVYGFDLYFCFIYFMIRFTDFYDISQSLFGLEP